MQMAREIPTVSQERRARRNAEREAPRPDGRQKLLVATEKLLGESSLAEITAAQIAEAAGVSRGTFYVHFESKFEVAAALLGVIMEEMYDLLAPITEGSEPTPDAAIRRVIAESAALWEVHGAVFRATHENYIVVPELREKWLAVTEQFTDALATALEGQIEAGRDIRQICAVLVWSTEHLLYIAGTDADADLPSPTAIIDTLVEMWVGTIYGRPPA
jgi:AcrR family transcriptional regulator